MFCVKMGAGQLRYESNLNLGDADRFSFFDAYSEHRAILREELGEEGYVWNSKTPAHREEYVAGQIR